MAIVKKVIVMPGASSESVYDNILHRLGRLSEHLDKAVRLVDTNPLGAKEMILRVKAQVDYSKDKQVKEKENN